MYTCNICLNLILSKDIYKCKAKCNSFYHLSCAQNLAYKVNKCPFCRSNNFYELPNLHQFYEYCDKGNLEEIKKLNLSLDDIISQNNVALRYASENGHLQVIKYLISFNLTIDDIKSVNNYALIMASSNGHLKVVKYLIDKGLTIEDIKSYDNYALRWASENGHLIVVKYLIDKGLTIEDIKSYDNYAIYKAIKYGHIELGKYLLSFYP